LAILALAVAECAIGMYVNLHVTVPTAGRGSGLGTEIADGPAWLSLHPVTGLALGGGPAR
jgi:hypothetical protein